MVFPSVLPSGNETEFIPDSNRNIVRLAHAIKCFPQKPTHPKTQYLVQTQETTVLILTSLHCRRTMNHWNLYPDEG